jgi:hypothetical protein
MAKKSKMDLAIEGFEKQQDEHRKEVENLGTVIAQLRKLQANTPKRERKPRAVKATKEQVS